MHPVFQRPSRLGWYLLSWIPFEVGTVYLWALPAGFTVGPGILATLPVTLYWALACLAPWNVCRQFPLRGTPPWKLWLAHLGAAAFASIVGANIASGMAYVLGNSARIKSSLPFLLELGVLWYLTSVGIHYALLAVEDSRRAEILAREAELRALKAQVNPHFLFNSLNSISALTAVDAERAREMCIRLADFLRATLGLGEKQSIAWRDELALTQSYLDVEQVRFGERLKVRIDAADACNGCQVPPLVLQPLVENAVKHGIATLVDGGSIQVEGRAVNGILAVTVENPFDPDAPKARKSSGLGLRNVRDRLEARYGSAARLETSVDNGRFRAELRLPFVEN
jgi:hypothetical protein